MNKISPGEEWSGHKFKEVEEYIKDELDKCKCIIETTYSALKTLRDAGHLIPGQQYRITDYVTTTKNDNTSIGEGKYKSAGHQFDIIVVADSTNKLNENARAIQHSEDTYFSGQNLESWDLKYSLDNDTNRFDWVNTSSGKGVIYYMKDNLNNEKYYDFKNIQFARKLDSEGNLDKVNGTLRWVYPIGIWKNGQSEDATLDANNDCHDTKEGYYFNSTSYKQYLNDGVTLGAKCYGWTCDNHCYGWTCGYNSRGWHVGTRCYNWICEPWCSDWTCGEHCDGWTCGRGCSEWKVGNRCYNWTCGPESNYWSCGNRCFNWECGDHCSGWHVGNHCYYWKVGNSCFDWYCEGECHDWNLFEAGSTTIANSCRKFHIESGFHTNIYVPVGGAVYQNFYISRGIDSNVTLSCPSGIEYKWIVTADGNGSIKQYKESDTPNELLLTNITYNELKSLRDNSCLIPGKQYRITDYRTTVNSDLDYYGTAGHLFDVIVVADDASHLNESARVCHHDGDTYFAHNKLESWEIKYCIDNVTNRFAWADSTNGKGVIYYMKDEFGNECYYDFKNLLIYRNWDYIYEMWSDISIVGYGIPCYTFSSASTESTTQTTDMSLNSENYVYGNVISGFEYEYDGNVRLMLNNVCFFGDNITKNTVLNDCQFCTILDGCSQNVLNSGRYIRLSDGCSRNNISRSSEVYFGSDCWDNDIKGSDSVEFYGHCCYNRIGELSGNISLGSDCRYNAFGKETSSLIMSDECEYNVVGDVSESVRFGVQCCHNILHGNIGDPEYMSSSVVFGDRNCNNVVDSGVIGLYFNNDDVKNYHILSSAESGGLVYDLVQWNYRIDGITSINPSQIVISFTDYTGSDPVEYTDITFTYSESPVDGYYKWTNENFRPIYTDSNSLTSCNIGDVLDISGYSPIYLNATPNLEYVTTVARKSNGKIVQYCEADLIEDQD